MRPHGPNARAGITCGNGNPPSDTNAEHGIQRRQRVIEIGSTIEDARLPSDANKVAAKKPSEKLAHLIIFGKETMRPDIETAALEGDRAGKSPNDLQAL